MQNRYIIVKTYINEEYEEIGVLKCPFGDGNIILGNKYTSDNIIMCMMMSEDNPEYEEYEDCGCGECGYLSDTFVVLDDYAESLHEFKEFDSTDFKFKEYRRYKMLKITEVAIVVDHYCYSDVKLNEEYAYRIYKMLESDKRGEIKEKYNLLKGNYANFNNELYFNISHNLNDYNLSSSYAFKHYGGFTYFKTEDGKIRYFAAD